MLQATLHAYGHQTNPTMLLLNQRIYIIELKTTHQYLTHIFTVESSLVPLQSNDTVNTKEMHHKKRNTEFLPK